MDLARLWDIGFRSLQHLRSPYGFNASEAITGLYPALFGRDSLWTLLFLLEAERRRGSEKFTSWVQEVTSEILTNLGKFQGKKINDETEEQPGKIIHEYHSEDDPHVIAMDIPLSEGRSYAGFDQTFLFVTAFRRFRDRFPDHSAVGAVWPNVLRALEWIEVHADGAEENLFAYRRRNPANLLNQVWKDSFDSATHTGADVPPPPLAWIDVQAYAYRAFGDAAVLLHDAGEACHRYFSARAEAVRRIIYDRFWMEAEGCLAMALDGTKRPVAMIGSNAAHALWAEVLDPGRAGVLVRRLMRPDMLTRYGLRTLSAGSPFYAPFTYHRGNTWPFDNAIFVRGLLSYGYHAEAGRVMAGVAEALLLLGSPVELYVVLDDDLCVQPSGGTGQALFRRRARAENSHQAWTAASMLFFAAALAQLTDDILPDA